MSESQSNHAGFPRRPFKPRLHRTRPATSKLICDGSVQNQVVRFGSLEPGHVTLAKRIILPFTVVLTLALCVVTSSHPFSIPYSALGLVAFLTTGELFAPLDFNANVPAVQQRNEIIRILLEWSCAALVLVFLGVAFKLTAAFPHDIIVRWFALTPVALLLVNSLKVPIAKRLALARSAVQRYVIVGANDIGLELSRRIQRSHSGGKFFGFLDFRRLDRLPKLPDTQVTGSCSARDFADFVRDNAITRVYLALPIATTSRIEALIGELRDTTASVYFVPNIFAFDLVQPRCVAINGMPVFSICDSPLHGLSGFWKRMFDVSMASLALVLTWPVMLMVALAIKQSSPGPVLFKQRRYGLHGEEILVYKFRSMTVCEDGPDVAQATRQDARVTPFGALLRRTSLDELPQIFNVLEGKMSFVGPRPHAVAHNEAYRKLINGYMIRHKVRPGITGWAQINGLRGETSTVEKMNKRVQYDIDYLKNWSLWLDLKIMVQTVLSVISDRNAY